MTTPIVVAFGRCGIRVASSYLNLLGTVDVHPGGHPGGIFVDTDTSLEIAGHFKDLIVSSWFESSGVENTHCERLIEKAVESVRCLMRSRNDTVMVFCGLGGISGCGLMSGFLEKLIEIFPEFSLHASLVLPDPRLVMSTTPVSHESSMMTLATVSQYCEKIFLFDNQQLLSGGGFVEVNQIIAACLVDASTASSLSSGVILSRFVSRTSPRESLLLKMESQVGRCRGRSRKLDSVPTAIFRGKDAYLKGGLVNIDSLLGQLPSTGTGTEIIEIESRVFPIASRGSLAMFYQDRIEVWDLISQLIGVISSQGQPHSEWIRESYGTVVTYYGKN